MEKHIFIVYAVAAFLFGAFLSGCNKDDDKITVGAHVVVLTPQQQCLAQWHDYKPQYDPVKKVCTIIIGKNRVPTYIGTLQ